jgi:chromatin assembly factor 1 subunit A
MDPPRIPLNNMRNTSLNFNGQSVTKPVKSFFSPASDVLKAPASSPQIPTANTKAKLKDPRPKDSKPKELLPPDKIEAFKQEVQAGNELSKVGLVEVLKLKFRGHTAGTIKATLDAVAVKGLGKHSKWVLRDDSEVTAQTS